MSDDFYTPPNRYICSVLEEMRTCHKSRNYSYLVGLIEEAQYLATKMEAGLYSRKEAEEWEEKRTTLKKEIKELIKQKKELECPTT